MGTETAERVDELNDEPEVGAFREMLCAHLATLAPGLAERVRAATENACDFGEVILIASQTVAEEGDRDLDDLVALDDLLRSFGVEPVAGSERGVTVVRSPLTSLQEIVTETQEGIFRRQLHVACNELIPESQRTLLLSTHPILDPEETVVHALYFLAVLWTAEALYEKSGQKLKGAKKKAFMEAANKEARTLLLAQGIVDPNEQA